MKEVLAGKEKYGLLKGRNGVDNCLFRRVDEAWGILRSRKRLECALEPDFVRMVGQRPRNDENWWLISGYGTSRIIVYSS